MSCDSSSTYTTTDSTSSDVSGVPTGFICIPYTDSSVDGDNKKEVLIDDEENPNDVKETVRQTYKGQLRLDIYIQYGLLTVYVIAGRNIYSKINNPPDIYVKVSLIPDNERNVCCKTTLYKESNKPVFDEKLSLELSEEDVIKRVYITVWSKNSLSRQHEFLGSMSFGLHRTNNNNQIASGWFYILIGEVGRNRHVRVNEEICAVKNINSLLNISKVLLCRNEFGEFGFSVCGSKPVSISRVDKNSSAYFHNLQQDDVILTVNGEDVMSYTSSQVANLIRNCRFHIKLKIQRKETYTADENEDKIKNGIMAKNMCSVKNVRHLKFDKVVNIDYGWCDSSTLPSKFKTKNIKNDKVIFSLKSSKAELNSNFSSVDKLLQKNKNSICLKQNLKVSNPYSNSDSNINSNELENNVKKHSILLIKPNRGKDQSLSLKKNSSFTSGSLIKLQEKKNTLRSLKLNLFNSQDNFMETIPETNESLNFSRLSQNNKTIDLSTDSSHINEPSRSYLNDSNRIPSEHSVIVINNTIHNSMSSLYSYSTNGKSSDKENFNQNDWQGKGKGNFFRLPPKKESSNQSDIDGSKNNFKRTFSLKQKNKFNPSSSLETNGFSALPPKCKSNSLSKNFDKRNVPLNKDSCVLRNCAPQIDEHSTSSSNFKRGNSIRASVISKIRTAFKVKN